MIRVGTRGSALALAQARWVAERLGAETELVTVTTSGDRSHGGDKSRWVAELERALLNGEVEVAVHSAKDVPTELAEGLTVLAIPERADPRDVICGAGSLRDLPPGARVGTSSLRRVAQIRAARGDLDVVPLRGNVDTRLRKLNAGEAEALVLAAAGLQRLGLSRVAGGRLDELVPAAGQGALLIEGRPGTLSDEQLASLGDAETTASVSAEREVVRALGASCNTPVGVLARTLGDQLELEAWVGMPDGSEWIHDRIRGPRSETAAEVAERMLAVGAADLLTRAERMVAA